MALTLGSKKLLSIDWDARHLRMAMVRLRADGVELLKVVSVPIPAEVSTDQAESLGAFLREAMRQARIGAKHVVLNVPREQVVLNTLNLPPTPEDEMAAVVQFQIVKELPFAAEKATIDFAICCAYDPKSPCPVLVAAVRNDDLAFYRDMAREAGLTIEQIGLRPHANLLAVLASLPDDRNKSMLVVEVGPLLTEIDIVQSGALTFSRAASVVLPDFDRANSQDVSDSRMTATRLDDLEPNEQTREVVGRLVVDVIRSFEAQRATDPSVKIDQIVVCGDTGLEPELAESLAGRFAAPARLFSPDQTFGLSPQRGRELRGFSAVLGLAMRQARRGLGAFDFLDPKKPVSRRAQRIRRAPVAILTAVLLIAAVVTFRIRFIGPKWDKVSDLDARIAVDKKRGKAIKAFKKQVKAVDDWKRSEQYWPEVLATVTEVFPPEAEALVTRLDFETRPRRKSALRTSTLKLKLRTAQLGTVSRQSAALRDLGFKEVTAGQETRIGMVRPGEVYRFDTSIAAQIPLRPALRKSAAPRVDAEPTAEEETAPNDKGSHLEGAEQTKPQPAAAGKGGRLR